MIGIYHKSDLDGVCCKHIMRRHWVPEDITELIGAEYGDAAPLTKLMDQSVWIADFSYDKKTMQNIHDVSLDLNWCDHHVSAIKEIGGGLNPGDKFFNYSDQSRSGCEILWDALTDEPMPLAVRLLGRYDVWDHVDPRVLPFQYGMRVVDEDNNQVWDSVLEAGDESDLIAQTIATGHAIIRYEQSQWKRLAEKAYVREWDGFKCLIVNVGGFTSKMLESHPEYANVDILIGWSYTNGEFTYSLRSMRAVDVSVIAKNFGGGGHKGAAGFKTSEFMFT